MEPDQIVSALRRHAPLALAHIVLGAIIGLAVPGRVERLRADHRDDTEAC